MMVEAFVRQRPFFAVFPQAGRPLGRPLRSDIFDVAVACDSRMESPSMHFVKNRSIFYDVSS